MTTLFTNHELHKTRQDLLEAAEQEITQALVCYEQAQETDNDTTYSIHRHLAQQHMNLFDKYRNAIEIINSILK
jgi:hypothetical protein